jgi:PAS domain S-box-containing protein
VVFRSSPLRFTLAPSSRRVVRYLGALAIVSATTVLRFAADPIIHEQIPYFMYVAAIVVTTWTYGVEAGVFGTIVAAFVGNYFFVSPRYVLTPDRDDWIAMGFFTGLALWLVRLVGRWRQAERDLAGLHAQTQAAALAAEVGVWTWTPGTSQVAVGANWRGLFGVAPDASVTLDVWAGALDPEDRQSAVETLNAAWRDQREFHSEYRVRLPGGVRWIIDRGRPTYDSDGRPVGMAGINLDITDRKLAEDGLRRSRDFLDKSQQIAHLGSWELDLAGNTLWWSDEVFRIFGLQPQEFGATYGAFLDAVHPDDRAAVNEAYSSSIREGRDYSIEHRIVRRATGEVRVVHEKCEHVRDRSGRIVKSNGAVYDVTERKRTEEALREADRLKDEFLATLSHELRTPLNAIIGWSDMLRRGNLRPEDMQRSTESIYRNAQLQSELIEDMLDVSRIITGKMSVKQGPVDLAALLHEAVESVRSAADAKRISLVRAETAALAKPITGDTTRLRQVLWNLLSNAVKFTPAGGTVTTTLQVADGQAQVQVADNGIGIGPDFLPHVFERFRQQDNSSTRTHGGLGLGLAIVRHLVELHGGTITAESAGEGKGATFTVRLPARFEELPRKENPMVRRVMPIEPVDADEPSLCGVRVLVVDDESDARNMAAAVLRHHGAATVALADNGASALQQVAVFKPSVLLIDIAMPDIDGCSLLERIRMSSGPEGTSVPAIAFTAYAREEDRRRTLASGFQRHLAKPVDSHMLVRAVAGVARHAPRWA